MSALDFDNPRSGYPLTLSQDEVTGVFEVECDEGSTRAHPTEADRDDARAFSRALAGLEDASMGDAAALLRRVYGAEINE